MIRVLSVYEAKKRFSEVLRGVRERGETCVVTYHGDPVAEIRPIGHESGSLEERLGELRTRGVLVGGRKPASGDFRPIAQRPGALQRFLDGRD